MMGSLAEGFIFIGCRKMMKFGIGRTLDGSGKMKGCDVCKTCGCMGHLISYDVAQSKGALVRSEASIEQSILFKSLI